MVMKCVSPGAIIIEFMSFPVFSAVACALDRSSTENWVIVSLVVFWNRQYGYLAFNNTLVSVGCQEIP